MNNLRKFQQILNEGISQEDLANVLCHRLEMRYPDIYKKYDYDKVYNVVDDVASFHAGAEELGSSDINIMLRRVIKDLESSNTAPDEFAGELDPKGRFTKDTVTKMFGNLSPDAKGVAEGLGPTKGDPVYYGTRLVGWFLGYSKLGKVITEPNYDEMGDEYANRDVYWDKDVVTIKSDTQSVSEGISDVVKGIKRTLKGKEHPDVVAAKHAGRAMGHYNQGDMKAGDKESQRYVKTRDMHLKAKGVAEGSLNEVSKKMLGRYVNKARDDLGSAINHSYRDYEDDEADEKDNRRAEKRQSGIDLARAKTNKSGKSGSAIAKVRATEGVAEEITRRGLLKGLGGAAALGGVATGIALSPMAYVKGKQIPLATPGPIPKDAKLMTADDGRKIYVWKTTNIKGVTRWMYRPAEDVKEEQINELSTEKLAQYKTAAGADARKADREGDYERGNKRFSGIVKATKKQFDNEAKPKRESAIMKGIQSEGLGLNDPETYEQMTKPLRRKGTERTQSIAFEAKSNKR